MKNPSVREQIVQFLRNLNTGKRSDKVIRQLIAERFEGEIVGQYVKIDGVEYLIRRNPDDTSCGFNVRIMDWEHGNEWTFFSPY